MMIKSAATSFLWIAFGSLILGLSMYFAWRPDEPKKIFPAPVAVPTLEQPTVILDKPEAPTQVVAAASVESRSSEETVEDVPMQKTEEPLPQETKSILIIVDCDGEQYKSEEWGAVKTHLTNKKNIKISFEFPQEIIPNEKNFRRWIAKANYYILARRILLVKDTSAVLKKNRDFLPVAWHATAIQGYILLNNESEKFILSVRGFEDFPAEIIALSEDIILKALKEPESMAEQDDVAVQKMSEKLERFGYTLSEHQERMTDRLIDACTRSTTSWKNSKEGDYFHSYLPLHGNKKFERADATLCAKYMDKVGIYLEGRTYQEVHKYNAVVFVALVEWVRNTDFAGIIKMELFRDMNAHNQ